ncbi:hypothetical protein DL766_009004 [Monosporascus sp. MC13-8B]|uniref:Uncharacterized protein n=1 Tax=Monosporascus cannonballus TaxID=155416 RepID=A0ABY0HLT7_9PEZI|nr:hypothetical protein DL762_000259 [Monosporascus cannonballus]RYO99347.1 hypothetical protein DL763_001521 [Monosporascus cannonballus]RYP16940.1 hypothetical protein DL766_009004 [Monosporascus sp. MC13-8B]
MRFIPLIAALLAFATYAWGQKNSHKRRKMQESRSRQHLEGLYPSPADASAGSAEIDIVAVNGLGTNVDWPWTWQDKTGKRPPVHWLKDADMLPAVLPKARLVPTMSALVIPGVRDGPGQSWTSQVYPGGSRKTVIGMFETCPTN